MTSFTIDAQDRDWTASLEILDANRAVISGPHDISDALISVDIDFSELRSGNRLNGWLAWEGSIVLSPELSTTVSLDNRDTASNPSGAEVLAMGNRITLSMWTGAAFERFWPPFYILREASPRIEIPTSESQAQITIDLGDLGKSLDLFTPENNYSGITQGTTTTPTTLIRNIATQIGLTTSSDTIAGGYSVNTAVQKKSTRSPVREIGEIAAAQKYVAWLDAAEELRLTPADFTLKTAPDFSLTIGIGGDEVGENGWEPVNLEERPPGELTVTGGSDLAQEIENPSVIVRTVPGPGYTSLTSTETKTITPVGGAPQTVITYEERQAELQIQPRVITTDNSGVVPTLLADTDNTSNGLQDSEDSSITHRYNGITKRLTETVELIRKARGLSGGDAFSEEENSSALTLLDNSRTTTTYTYDNILGVVSSRTITERRPWCLWEWGEKTPTNYELNRFLERDYSIQTTTWTRVLDVSGDPAIEAWRVEQVTQQPRGVIFKNYTGANPETLVNNPDPDLTFTLQASDGSTRPPDIEYQESIYTEEHQEFTGSVTVQPISGNAHKWKEGAIRVNADVIVSDRQCNDLAEWAAKWQHGLSLGRSFIGAIPTELFTTFDPVSRVDVIVDGNIEAYFLNGFSISSNLTETLFGCNFGLIGQVGVTPDVVTSPIIVQQFATLIGGAWAGGTMASGAQNAASLTGGAVAGGVLESGLISSASLIGGAVVGGTLASSGSALAVGGALAGATMRSGIAELVGGAVAGGVMASGGAARLIGGALAGGTMTSGVRTGLTAIASGVFTDDGTTITELFLDGVNAGGITREATGRWLVTLATPMPSADFIAIASADPSSGVSINYSHGAQSVSTTTLRVWREARSGAGANPNIQKVSFAVWG